MNKSSFYLLHWTCLKLIFKLNWVKLLWTNLQWIFQRVHENKMLWSSSAQPWTRILSWLAKHQNGQVSVIISCSSVWSILLTNECTATTFKEGNRPKIRFCLIHPSLFPPPLRSLCIDTVQIQFGVCQKWKSYTIEVLLTFYYFNKTL